MNYDHTMTSLRQVIFDHGSGGLSSTPSVCDGASDSSRRSISFLPRIFDPLLALYKFLLNKLLSRWKGNLRAVRDRPKLNFFLEDKLLGKG